jgi:hypothetical protein
MKLDDISKPITTCSNLPWKDEEILLHKRRFFMLIKKKKIRTRLKLEICKLNDWHELY